MFGLFFRSLKNDLRVAGETKIETHAISSPRGLRVRIRQLAELFIVTCRTVFFEKTKTASSTKQIFPIRP